MDRLHLMLHHLLPALLTALLLASPARAQDAPPPDQQADPAGQQAPPGEQESTAETLSEFRPTLLVPEEDQNLAATPGSVAELMELESRIRGVVERVLPATVALSIGASQGSGVIISPDGYVLTAAHVTGRPGQRVAIIMPDGTRYQGVSLGVNQELDDGLVKITDPRATDLPWVPLASARELPLGTWTVALGHPGGYHRERPPVVRVGRVLANNNDFVMTDNTLVGGDSGGPLFDLNGAVIGIHSRIGGGMVNNIHVPSDRFLADWEELAASRRIGGPPRWQRVMMRATDGLETDPTDVGSEGARVVRLIPDGPADKAGIRINDRIIAIGGDEVENGQDFMLRRMRLRPDRPVIYTVRRGEETLEVEVVPVAPGRNSAARVNLPVLLGQAPLQSDNLSPVIGIMPDSAYPHPGVRLGNVQEGGPAHQAGLTADDVILTIEGRFIRTNTELTRVMRRFAVGDRINLRVLRDGQIMEITLELGDRSEVFPGRYP